MNFRTLRPLDGGLTNAIIYDIIKQKIIKNRTVLNASAQTQKEEGKTDLFNFIITGPLKPLMN